LHAEAAETALLALPVVVTQIGFALMGAVDSAIVGRLLGRDALGGIGLGNALFFGISLLAMGTIMAVDPLVAQRFGAGERARCGEPLWNGIWLSAILAVPFTALFLHSRPLLALLDQPPETASLAEAFLRGRAWNVPTMLVFTALRGFLNGVGNTRATMVVVIAANVVNGAVVYGLARAAGSDASAGVAGAGYGTSVAGLFMAAAMAWIVVRGGYGDCGIAPRRPDPRGLRETLRFGLPIGGTIVAEVGVFTATAVVMGQLGRDALAAHQIALQLASLTFMVPLGISVAASIRVGHAIGARDPAAVRRAGDVSYLLGVGFMGTSALAFALAPGPLARIFLDEAEVASVLPLAVTLIRIGGLFQLSDGAQAVGAGCLRGAGDSRTAFLVNLAAHWGIGFPVGYGLAVKAGWGAPGLWYGLTASLTLVAVLLFARFRTARLVDVPGPPVPARPAEGAEAPTGCSPSA
jgi:MATE family multidrug resistance protein